MLGHISFGVQNLARSQAFYDAVMTALWYERVYIGAKSVGYGLAGASSSQDKLLLTQEEAEVIPPSKVFHLAFDAPSREAVDRFHQAALQFGGVDNGASGLRPHYGADYYVAFVIDPDGYRLEAKHPPA